MKCFMKYAWIKLPRAHLPNGKGLLGFWARLASRAAFRNGSMEYCGHLNAVGAGMWSGGIVGLKSILQADSRAETICIMNRLAALDLIRYEIRPKSKKLTYTVTEWIVGSRKVTGEKGVACATDGYGFVQMPRNLPERLIGKHFIFQEADAWIDLWCHTTSEEPDNAFSFLAPTVQFGRYGAVITLETLGRRWGWEKTKVWRFFKKHGDVFSLYRLPGSYGCLVFNRLYPTGRTVSIPTQETVCDVIRAFYRHAKRIKRNGNDRDYLNRLVAAYSRTISSTSIGSRKNRVALLRPFIRAYLSPCRKCGIKNDCREYRTIRAVKKDQQIRGPCGRRNKREGVYPHEKPKENIP